MLADDDVARLDVAMQHAAAMGVIDGIARVHEPAKQLAHLQRAAAEVFFQTLVGMKAIDGFLEGIATNETHDVEGPAIGVRAQAINRHDAGMLKPAGDLGLEQEPLAADRVVGMLIKDLLERDLAMELGIERHEYGAQAAARMRTQHAEPLAVGRGRAHGVIDGTVGIGLAVMLGCTVP